MTFRLHPLALATFAAGVLSACGGSDDASVNALPTGVSNLRTASAPTYADPLNPTAAELRRAAIYTSYRALVDMTSNGGYGSLYGPMVGATGTAAASDGKVAGTEYVAFYNLSDSQQNVTVMAQVPATFDPANPCIVTATSAGSRGRPSEPIIVNGCTRKRRTSASSMQW